METYTKNRLLFWIMIFLVIVNLSALATYFIFPQKAAVVKCGDDTVTTSCNAYQMELDLTEEQINAVEKITTAYQDRSTPISQDIKALRAEILDELASREPDTFLLNELSVELSHLQGKLHRENMKHYLELKEVCTPEQALCLSNLYMELYGCQVKVMRKGK